jgi:hypothetical protein
MRVSFLVYGVLYVAFEIVGNQLEKVGWASIDPLDVASALTDALLTIVICIALLVAADLGHARWGPALRAWNEERLRTAAEAKLEKSWAEVSWDDEPIGVRSWRPEPLALPAPVPSSPAGTYYTPSTYGPPFPEEPGPQI